MKPRLSKNKILTSLVICALLLSSVAVALPAKTVQGAVTVLNITSPKQTDPAYAKPGGSVTVNFDITVDASAVTRIYIEVSKGSTVIGTLEFTQMLEAAGSPYSLSKTVNITGGTEGQKYDVKVAAVQPVGGYFDVTDTETDAVIIDTTPPAVPTLTSPADGDILPTGTPAFQWLAVTDPSGVTYDLQVDNNSDFSSPEINLTGHNTNSYTPTSSLTDGKYHWRVRAVDGAGNASSWSGSRQLTIDTQAPTVNLNAYVPDPTNDSTPTYSGTATDTLTKVVDIEYRVDGGAWTDVDPFTPATTVNFSFTTTTLSEGTRTIEVRAKDEAGNWTTAPYPSDTLKIDVTAPTVTLTPYTPDPTSDNTPTYSGTASDTASKVAQIQYRVDSGAWTDVSPFTPATTVSFNFTTTTLSDGTHTICARAQDEAGNWTASPACDTLTIDTGAPTAVLTPYTPDPTNDNTPTYQGVASSAGTNIVEIQYRVDGGAWQNVTGFSPATAVAFNFTPAALTDGTHTFEVRAKNAAGVWSQPPYPLDTLTIDTQAPTVVELLAPNGGENWNAGSSQTIRWRAYDNVPNQNVTVKLEYSTNGGTNWTTIVQNLSKQQGEQTYSWTVPSAHSNNCMVRVTIIDAAGNSGNDVSDSAFTISDTTNPTVTVLSPNGGETWRAGTTQTIKWKAQDNVAGNNMKYDIYYCTNYGSSPTWQPISVGVLINRPQCPQDTSPCTYDWTLPNLTSTASTCRVKVVARDVNNNSAEDISDANFTILVDTTAPTVQLTSFNTGGSVQAGTCRDITWTANDNEPGALTIKLEYYDTSWHDIVTLTNVAQGNGSFTWIVPGGSAIGTGRKVRVTATDGSGQSASAESATGFEITPNTGLNSHPVALSTGWNLVSLPLVPPCSNIQSILAGVLNNVQSVWWYDPNNAPIYWRSWSPTAGGDLTTMDACKAYFVKMKSSGTLTVWGKPAVGEPPGPLTCQVKQGWNMVGFRSTINRTVGSYLPSSPAHSYVYRYDAVGGSYQQLTDAQNMTPGEGYWVWFTQDGSFPTPVD